MFELSAPDLISNVEIQSIKIELFGGARGSATRNFIHDNFEIAFHQHFTK